MMLYENGELKPEKQCMYSKQQLTKSWLSTYAKQKIPKAAWDILAALFSKKNEARLQLLESELMAISQGDLTINQYFKNVKSLCNEITELNPEEKISEQRMRRIITHGLRPEYSGFMATVRGWSTQPTLIELENMLANQEALTKQTTRVSSRREEEALFSSQKKGRPNNKSKPKFEGKPNQQRRPNQMSHASGGARN